MESEKYIEGNKNGRIKRIKRGKKRRKREKKGTKTENRCMERKWVKMKRK